MRTSLAQLVSEAPGGGPQVALVTEGTYPCGGGGVAVWCDQLIRGLPGTTFHVVAINLTHRDRPFWELPPNVGRLTLFPIWDRVQDRLHDRRGASPDTELLARFAQFVTQPSADRHGEITTFLELCDDFVALAQRDGLAETLRFDPLCAAFAEALIRSEWLAHRHAVSLADAFELAEIFLHVLRPLGIDTGPVDAVHTSANGLCSLVALASQRRYGSAFMLAEHGLYLRERYIGSPNELRRPVIKSVVLRFYRILSMAAYQRATLVAPCSEFNRRWELALGAPPERTMTLHNGVNPEEFPLRPADPARPEVVWLGRIDPLKDIHTLIRAAAAVKPRVPHARFRLYGEEPIGNPGYLASCRDLVAELGVEDVVSFEGRIDHPVNAFHQGQFSVLSSISEGFPYTVLESMSCGVPVVGTDVGGVAEAIADTGLVVPARDPIALGDACVRLLTASPEYRVRLGDAARARVERYFALHQMLLRHDEFYRTWQDRGPVFPVVDLLDGARTAAVEAARP